MYVWEKKYIQNEVQVKKWFLQVSCNLTLQLPEVINMELLPKCPYIIQQTDITNTLIWQMSSWSNTKFS